MSAKRKFQPPFPAKLRIGFKTFAVERWASHAAAAAQRYGECDKVGRIIRVDCQHGAAQTAETLLHEIVHAVKDVSPLRLKGRVDEEELAQLISQGLTQVMQDNPALRTWLAWAWQEGAAA